MSEQIGTRISEGTTQYFVLVVINDHYCNSCENNNLLILLSLFRECVQFLPLSLPLVVIFGRTGPSVSKNLSAPGRVLFGLFYLPQVPGGAVFALLAQT